VGKGGKLFLLILLAAALAAGCSEGGIAIRRDTLDGHFHILWDFATGLSPTDHAIRHLREAFPEASFDYRTLWRHMFPIDGEMLESRSGREQLYPHVLAILDDAPADLAVFEHTLAPDYFASGYLEPLDDYLAADPSIRERLGDGLLERVREQGGGSVYAVPFAKNVYVLYYNKDIFDRFQLPYPTDGMTWDDVFALARRFGDVMPIGELTAVGLDDRSLSLIDISAFDMPDRHLAFGQMGGRFPDPETGPPDFRDPAWERYGAFLEELASLRTAGRFHVYKTFAAGNLAMTAGRLHGSPHYSGAGDAATDLLMAPFAKWDMVSFPVFADAPDTGPPPAYYYIGIPKNSPRKRESFRLISHLLSDEVQLENSKSGLASVRSEPVFREVFAERTYKALGKNVEAFFYHPEEADFGPHYDMYLQYHFYQHGTDYADPEMRERHFASLREDYAELADYRRFWREITAFLRE